MSAGVVYLVGAGPGDPGLLTLRAAELIGLADVVFHDRLIPVDALSRMRPDAERVYVGKTPGIEADADGSVSQEEICRMLVEAGRAGRTAVRLKGGDPFVFGRGGEEVEALHEAGIRYEVVPGITAAVAAPAYAGIPVTHRDDAGAVAFVTGHGDMAAPDWRALAAFPGTLAVYMGVGRLAENSAALIDAGRDPDEPAAVIERGTLPGQRVIHATLATIAERAAGEAIRAPSLVVIGAVVARGESLAWFGAGPLRGKTVVVTRARDQSAGINSQLAALGAEVVELPLIRVQPRLDAPEVREMVTALHTYALVVLTSANGVARLFEAIFRHGRDARALAQATVAAVGPATAQALRDRGIEADLVAERAVAEGLADALEKVDVAGRPVLLAGAAGMRPVLAERLGARGAEVDSVVLYETVPEEVDPEALAAAREADYLTVASASAARKLARALGAAPAGDEGAPSGAGGVAGRLISIGPIASAAAHKAGLTVHAEADPHTIEGLLATVVADAT